MNLSCLLEHGFSAAMCPYYFDLMRCGGFNQELPVAIISLHARTEADYSFIGETK